MRLNFTVYGSQYTYGWLPQGAELIAADKFVAEAVRRGFAGVEVPARTLEKLDERQVKALRSDIDKHRLEEVIVSAFGTDVDYLVQQVKNAALLGAGTVRTVVGGADYGGDRRPLKGRWAQFMDDVRARMGTVLKEAEKLGVSLAIENHQDVNSEDLLALCHHFESRHFGVVLDVANPLAVAEHPIDFAELVMPYIKYVHLKDYVIYWSKEGYRLVRCPVGSGAVPTREIISLLKKHGRGASASLEVAALEARHVRVFEDDFWPDYPPRTAAQLARTLAFVRQHARPESDDYRTPFERGASPENIAAYEERELQESIRLASALTGDRRPLGSVTSAEGRGTG